MRTHTERESKYELPPHAELPSLAELATSVGPRDEKLDAVYYDTLNLRLIRSGLTLRKRTGGKDAGWHLKIPRGADTREELHFPLGDSNTAAGRAGRADPRLHPRACRSCRSRAS